MSEVAHMKISFRKVPNNEDLFEFTIITPLLRTQFRLPRAIVNKLRVEMERALTEKAK